MKQDLTQQRRKSIFHFLDYREYLQHLFHQQQEKNSSFSYRSFARLANSSSPNFLQLIRAKKLNISTRQMESIARNINLKDKDVEYFRSLVTFDHADEHSEKNTTYKKLINLRETRTVCHRADHQYTYLSNWYTPVIRKLICSSAYPDDPQWLVKTIVPTIGLREVKKSIQLLQELSLINRNSSDTGWVNVDGLHPIPAEVPTVAVVEHHTQMLKKASESLSHFEDDHRDLRAMTLGIPKEKLPELKEKMTSFWEEIIEMSNHKADGDVVVQVNTQLFPFMNIDDAK